jgi:hypothetical protein
MVNLECYVNSILELFFQMLTEEEKQYAYFQQDNAAAHTSQHSMEATCGTFGERMVLFSCLAYSLALKMEVTCSSEISVDF